MPCLLLEKKTELLWQVIKGDETDEELQLLAEDIFRYFGLVVENVNETRFLSKDYELSRLLKTF